MIKNIGSERERVKAINCVYHLIVNRQSMEARIDAMPHETTSKLSRATPVEASEKKISVQTCDAKVHVCVFFYFSFICGVSREMSQNKKRFASSISLGTFCVCNFVLPMKMAIMDMHDLEHGI